MFGRLGRKLKVLFKASITPQDKRISPELAELLHEQIAELAAKGRSQDAIKLAREQLGLTLADAKALVGNTAAEKSTTQPSKEASAKAGNLSQGASNNKMDEVRYLLQVGRKEEAVTLYQKVHGVSNAAAVEAVEKLPAT